MFARSLAEKQGIRFGLQATPLQNAFESETFCKWCIYAIARPQMSVVMLWWRIHLTAKADFVYKLKLLSMLTGMVSIYVWIAHIRKSRTTCEHYSVLRQKSTKAHRPDSKDMPQFGI